MKKVATAEKIGKHSSTAGRRYAKRDLARVRRRNERRAIRAGAWEALPIAARRDFISGWND